MNISHLFNDRIFLFAGHYGSGKTEVAVNFALALSRAHKTAIVDFDIVNPYFRTADAKETLERNGVRVVAPMYANTNVEIPALPAEISALFDDKSYKAVFDVGGDDAGAKAVSRYHGDFIMENYSNFFVFNIRRPSTSSVEKIIEYFYEIQESARLPFTAIINNTNLLGETREPDLLEGLETAEALSRRLSLPIAFSAYMADGAPGGVGAIMPGDAGAVIPGGFSARSAEAGVPVFVISKHINMDFV